MIETFKNKIANFLLKKHKKSHPTAEINFNKFFSNSSNILLIAPENNNDLKYIEQIIHYLHSAGKEVSVLIAEHKVSLMNNKKGIKFLTYGLADINKLNLPSPKLKSILVNCSFDVVIDLNSIPNRFFRAVGAYCQSKVSIGFKGENADTYYNFQITAEINTKNSYENLLNSLKMF